MLSMMVGELETSTARSRPRRSPAGPSTAHPGFSFDYTYSGPGLRIREVPKHSPGSYPKTRLTPGEYVLAINGKEVRLDEHLWQTLNYLEEGPGAAGERQSGEGGRAR